MNREPATEWPDYPLTKAQARNLLEEDIIAVWVMDYKENTRNLACDTDIEDDAVLDIVLEMDDRYEIYSYTDYEGETTWVSFGTEWKGTERGEMMQDTLKSYQLLVTNKGD